MTSIPSNLAGSFTAYSDHGLILIEDTQTEATHNGWDPESQYVHAESDSVYLAVQSLVDGPVSVLVYRDEAPPEELAGLERCFSGELQSKFGSLRVKDPDDAASLTIRAKQGSNALTIYVDQPNWTEKAVLVLA